MTDLRSEVLDQLQARGVTRYALSQLLRGKRPNGADVPRATVYKFLNGTRSLSADDLGLIFDALGLRVTGGKRRR